MHHVEELQGLAAGRRAHVEHRVAPEHLEGLRL
jgi:hypothetical protein